MLTKSFSPEGSQGKRRSHPPGTVPPETTFSPSEGSTEKTFSSSEGVHWEEGQAGGGGSSSVLRSTLLTFPVDVLGTSASLTNRQRCGIL
jgi:hypothetical protein